jgi:hypothetical protein
MHPDHARGDADQKDRFIYLYSAHLNTSEIMKDA